MKLALEPVARNSATAADGGSSDRSIAANAQAVTTVAPIVEHDTPPSTFTIRLRGINQTDAEARIIEGDNAEVALTRALEAVVSGLHEPVMRWEGSDSLVAVDMDRREGAAGIDDTEILRLFPTTIPQPLAAWRTHGRNLRVIFTEVDGVPALALAAVWFLFAPFRELAAWRVEIKTETRHPLGEREGAKCGRVHLLVPSASFVIPGEGTRAVASPEQIQEWLDARGLVFGRHPSESCPWCGGSPASGNPPVLIDERGIKCFRCNRFASWDGLAGDMIRPGRPTLYEAARAFVHFPHARLVLRDMRPSTPDVFFQPAWTLMLEEGNQDRLTRGTEADKKSWKTRIDLAASSRFDIVRSVGGEWLDVLTLKPRKVAAERTMKRLPWCLTPEMIDAALNGGPLRGFVPVEPLGPNTVLGPFLPELPGAIRVHRPHAAHEAPAVDLGGARPSDGDEEGAWAILDARYPGINHGYVKALIAARFFAQRAAGTPPIICVTGGSGSAKTGTMHLVGAAVGSSAASVSLGTSDDTRRAMGLALAAGAGLLFIDEVGRTPQLYARLEPILAANTTLTFRAKYRNEATVPMSAAIAILGSTLPSAILRSPELARRGVGFRLLGANRDWRRSKDEDLALARSDDKVRPSLDVITRAVWWDIWELGPAGSWKNLCMTKYGAVALPALDLVDDGVGRDEAVRRLYERYRSVKDEELTEGLRWRGWLKAQPKTPDGDLLGELIDFDGSDEKRNAERAELERLSLEPILGFSWPQLQLLVHRRSAMWLLKFVQVGVLAGRGVKRAALPPSRAPAPAPEVEMERVEL